MSLPSSGQISLSEFRTGSECPPGGRGIHSLPMNNTSRAAYQQRAAPRDADRRRSTGGAWARGRGSARAEKGWERAPPAAS